MSKTIIICDDDEGIVDVSKIILEDQGYNVVTVSDSSEIFDTIEATKPDLILLDLWMADLSGEEICKRLKADKITKKIPIIIVSASKDTEKVAKSAGADDFLFKPFDISTLETTVEKYINRRNKA